MIYVKCHLRDLTFVSKKDFARDEATKKTAAGRFLEHMQSVFWLWPPSTPAIAEYDPSNLSIRTMTSQFFRETASKTYVGHVHFF